MADVALYLSATALLFWFITLALPWRAWQVNEVLEAANLLSAQEYDLSDLTVLIPARNEADLIGATLAALNHQGSGLQVVLVDDDSTDATQDVARRVNLQYLRIIQAEPMPPGWSGKLWALEQGLYTVNTPLTLLLDADIVLLPGLIRSLKEKHIQENIQLVSLMAVLRFDSFWEKLLMPAFIHFFKMIYPFHLSNQSSSKLAAAAGGCLLVETSVLREIGGMASIQNALIDDCALAKKVKAAGYKTWIGLTHGVLSMRPYVALTEIWDMVARTAFTQLFYSTVLLLLCTVLMLLMYIVPVLGVFLFQGMSVWVNLVAVVLMILIYLPTLRFYAINWSWGFAMPVIAGLYLLMTWTSALRYWRGERSRWKGRIYQKV